MDDIVKARSSSKIYICIHRQCIVRRAIGNKNTTTKLTVLNFTQEFSSNEAL